MIPASFWMPKRSYRAVKSIVNIPDLPGYLEYTNSTCKTTISIECIAMAVIAMLPRRQVYPYLLCQKYLNHPDHVREDTRRRVEAAIKELNYLPSITARKHADKADTDDRHSRSGYYGCVFYTDVFNSIKYYSLFKGL